MGCHRFLQDVFRRQMFQQIQSEFHRTQANSGLGQAQGLTWSVVMA